MSETPLVRTDGCIKIIRVLLADDHNVIREALRALLNSQPGINVVGEAKDGLQAIKFAKELTPDVVLLDFSMPILNGAEAASRIRATVPSARVLIFSYHHNKGYRRESMESGALGYVTKDVNADDLFAAIRCVARGEHYLCNSLSPHGTSERTSPALPLSARQTEVLHGIAEGLGNKQIASSLCISIKTVEKHRQELMNKLRIHNTASLTRYAVAAGVVSRAFDRLI